MSPAEAKKDDVTHDKLMQVPPKASDAVFSFIALKRRFILEKVKNKETLSTYMFQIHLLEIVSILTTIEIFKPLLEITDIGTINKPETKPHSTAAAQSQCICLVNRVKYVVKYAIQHQPFFRCSFAFAALELPVKGRLEEWLHPRIQL